MTGWGRLALVVFGLGTLVALPFVVWGDGFEAAFSVSATTLWLREQESWAWAAAIGLLVSDLVLPIPGTSVMAALGIVYGPVLGGLIGAAGSIASGLIAYGLCRAFGQRAFAWIAGDAGVGAARDLFGRRGGWLVALSRWLPVLPETVACLAGLARMRFATFLLALACGSLPLGLTFATVGHWGADTPLLVFAASALVPALLWGGVVAVSRRRAVPSPAPGRR
ncbi:MAG: TVP38/TMEM64 family protein [Pseudomonadota bacterium]